jgi:beta-lactamase superfamily II metal-dependent hydrolase
MDCGLSSFLGVCAGTGRCCLDVAAECLAYALAGDILLPAFDFSSAVPVAEGQLKVTALDVGQGMALLIETSAHRLLYDTGPAYSAESDSGSRIILPYLKAQGVNGLDAMIVSHNDSDHSGGALSILKQMPVGLVLSSLNSDSAIVAESRQHRRCQSGQVWRWDGILFEILQPVAASYDSTKWKPNARSCVLKVSTSHYAMLLPGDIEAVQEDELVNSIPDKLRANVCWRRITAAVHRPRQHFCKLCSQSWLFFNWAI